MVPRCRLPGLAKLWQRHSGPAGSGQLQHEGQLVAAGSLPMLLGIPAHVRGGQHKQRMDQGAACIQARHANQEK